MNLMFEKITQNYFGSIPRIPIISFLLFLRKSFAIIPNIRNTSEYSAEDSDYSFFLFLRKSFARKFEEKIIFLKIIIFSNSFIDKFVISKLNLSNEA